MPRSGRILRRKPGTPELAAAGRIVELGYAEGPDYVEDTARAMTGLETVVSGALAEEIVEDLAEDIEEDLAEES